MSKFRTPKTHLSHDAHVSQTEVLERFLNGAEDEEVPELAAHAPVIAGAPVAAASAVVAPQLAIGKLQRVRITFGGVELDLPCYCLVQNDQVHLTFLHSTAVLKLSENTRLTLNIPGYGLAHCRYAKVFFTLEQPPATVLILPMIKSNVLPKLPGLHKQADQQQTGNGQRKPAKRSEFDHQQSVEHDEEMLALADTLRKKKEQMD